jgi:lipopolysaccharide/colanic/teichoic acid biosynthesis glycosyltransferase
VPSVPILREAAPVENAAWQAVSVCERLAAAMLLTALAPAISATAMAIAVMSRRTPFIAHKRVGWRGRDLWMLKLRTMWTGAEAGGPRGWIDYIDDEAGPRHKGPGDPRISNWFAGFCRRHSIDELPQLWHVVRGEMSLVGPRPLTAGEIRRYYGSDAGELVSVRPGLGGLWQISGRNRLTYAERRALDLKLVRSRSLGMYVSVLLRTIPEVLSGGNTW